jgi:hypothetical protein
MKQILITLSLFLSLLNSSAQQFKLSGSIQDPEGNPVPFASVFIKGTTKGTAANIDGQYSFTIDQGTFTIVYKAIGYKVIEKELNISANISQNIVLTAEAFSLSGVTINSNAEDPAYEVIRQAIKTRKEHLTEVKSYTSNVYIKGVQKLVGAPKKIFGRDVQKVLDLDTNRKGMLYLSESTSTFAYKYPDQIHEEMISSKTAGTNKTFSFNKASDLIINFYDNILLENKLSTRGFISPISDNALHYYRYKLLGVSMENGTLINKIEVIPRRAHDPVFRGTIYIRDDSWHLVNVNLYLTKNTGINLLDTLNISQQFLKTGSTYMPSNTNFQFNGNILGFKFEGYYIGVYSNYNLQPNFPKHFFNGEILNINKAVNKKDSLFWLNNRPIPLTAEESRNYIRKDSIAVIKNSSHYLDSIERADNKIGPFSLVIFGHTINKYRRKEHYTFDPLTNSLFYNTVEGLTLKPAVVYKKDLEDQRSFSIRAEARYGFSNKTFTGNLTANYLYNPLKRANISISAGSGIFDLNNYGSMSLYSNSINSLLFETNYSKFYKKEFANIGTTRGLTNGLLIHLSANYSQNTNLVNSTNYKFDDFKGEQFTSNNPFTPAVETPLFPTYQALTLKASLNYTFKQRYITHPDGRIYQPPKYPAIDLSYRKGVKNILSSDVDYDLVSVEIAQERIKFDLWGYSSIMLEAGKFLNNDQIYYPEAKHFRGNNSLFSLPELRKFLFLDFYLFSTDREYIEAHLEHNFAGMFSNKVPFLRKLKLEELIGANYLSQPLKKDYSEFYFGVQRLIFRAVYGFSFNGRTRIQHGFRLSYGF